MTPSELLQACADLDHPVLVCSDQPLQVVRAKVRAVDRCSFSLRLLTALESPPLPGHVASVLFNHGVRSGALYAAVESVTGRQGLRLRIPTEALYVNVRESFRVPVQKADLRATIRGRSTREIPVTVVDVSRSGVGLAAVPKVLRGARVTVTLEHEGVRVQLMGQVAAVRQGQLGLQISQPPADYLKIVTALERAHVRRVRRGRAA